MKLNDFEQTQTHARTHARTRTRTHRARHAMSSKQAAKDTKAKDAAVTGKKDDKKAAKEEAAPVEKKPLTPTELFDQLVTGRCSERDRESEIRACCFVSLTVS